MTSGLRTQRSQPAGWLLCSWILGAAALAGASSPGQWAPAGQLSVGRYAPAAAALSDGTVLIAGGYSFESKQTLASAEVFDPGSGRWRPGGAMRFDRNFGQAVELRDGTVLVMGGYRERQGTTAVVERFDPLTERFTDGPPLNDERELFTATLLTDGRVLVVGGYSTRRRQTLNSLEIYDPPARSFRRLPARLAEPRFGHEALRLPDGHVLIAGGKAIPGETRAMAIEIFDPESGQFAGQARLGVGRDRPTLSLVGGGTRVLIAGGSAQEGGTRAARTCEVYDLPGGKLLPGPPLLRDRFAHSAVPLSGGRILLVGGWSDSLGGTVAEPEIYDPEAGRFVAGPAQGSGRHDQAAVLLKDGRVLVAGGKRAGPGINESPTTAEIFSPGR